MSRLFAISALAVFAAPAPAAEPVEFRRDVIAALSRAGCNSGACHGSPQGKNGFRLSLRGGDPDLDFTTIAKEQGGRRVNRLAPDDSLLLLKASTFGIAADIESAFAILAEADAVLKALPEPPTDGFGPMLETGIPNSLEISA